MSKKLLFKGGLATGMRPYEIEDFSTLYMRDARVDEKTKAYIDSVIGNSVLNLCPYRNVLVTHKYDTVEGNVITLDDCQDNEVIQFSEIQGNTMVNCCKDGFVEIVDGLRRQTLKIYQPETTMKFSGNTTTTVTILIPMKNV